MFYNLNKCVNNDFQAILSTKITAIILVCHVESQTLEVAFDLTHDRPGLRDFSVLLKWDDTKNNL